MKNASRNKFLLCFRPIDIDSDAADYSADQVLSYISVTDKDEKMKQKKNKDMDHTPALSRTPSSGRSFSDVVKAIFFETSRSKRVRERKQRRKRAHRSDSDLSDEKLESNSRQRKRPHKSYSDPSDNKFKVQQKLSEIIAVKEQNQISSPKNPPALVSATWDKLECVPERKKSDGPTSIDKERNSIIRNSRNSTNLNHVLYLLVFSLLVTVFWGKMWAVMMTTIWIYADQLRRNLCREKVREEESYEERNTGRRKNLRQSGGRD